MRPPGTQLLVWAGRLLGRRTVERIVKPVVADLRWECDHAPVNNTWRRRRILAAGYVGFWKAIVLYGFAAAVHNATTWSETDRATVYRVGLVAAIAVALGTTLMLPLPAQALALRAGRSVYALASLLLPGALAVTLPLGLFVGILAGLAGRPASRRVYAACVAAGLLCSLLTLVLSGWIAPIANQAFRVAVAGHELERGIGELTLAELRARAFDIALRASPTDARRAALALEQRLWLSAAGVILATLASAISALLARHHRATPSAASQ